MLQGQSQEEVLLSASNAVSLIFFFNEKERISRGEKKLQKLKYSAQHRLKFALPATAYLDR